MKTEDNEKEEKNNEPIWTPEVMKGGKQRHNKGNQGARGHVARWFKNRNARNTSTRRMRSDPPVTAASMHDRQPRSTEKRERHGKGKKVIVDHDGAVTVAVAVAVGC